MTPDFDSYINSQKEFLKTHGVNFNRTLDNTPSSTGNKIVDRYLELNSIWIWRAIFSGFVVGFIYLAVLILYRLLFELFNFLS